MAAVAVVTVVEVVMLVDRSGMIVTVVCSITVFVLLRLSGLAYCAPGQIPHLPCSVCLGSLVVQDWSLQQERGRDVCQTGAQIDMSFSLA